MTSNPIENFILKTTRLYTYNTPIARGRHRAYLAALKLCKTLPDRMTAETKDGRKFSVHLKTGMQTTVYFLGEYEKVLTEIVTAVLREGDVCLDVGANFGWYSTIFHKYCGPSGEVHAFEPMPPTFRELEENYALMGTPANVSINNLGLGEKADELTINLFEGLSTGHASMSDQHRSDAISFKCDVVTLDSYLEARNVGDVNFVKVDIEGAEMMFLKGAEKLFAQKTPPIWLMEMALQQTSNFGYKPNDLIEFMRERAEYDFYKVDELNSKLLEIGGFDDDDIGANVICFPREAYRDRFASLKDYF